MAALLTMNLVSLRSSVWLWLVWLVWLVLVGLLGLVVLGYGVRGRLRLDRQGPLLERSLGRSGRINQVGLLTWFVLGITHAD